MTVKIKSSPFNLNVVQVYAPTTEATEEDIDNFYTLLESTIKDLPRREIVIVQGDLNAKIGSTADEDAFKG